MAKWASWMCIGVAFNVQRIRMKMNLHGIKLALDVFETYINLAFASIRRIVFPRTPINRQGDSFSGPNADPDGR